MEAVGESGFRSGKYGAQIDRADFRNLQVPIGHQHNILRASSEAVTDETQQDGQSCAFY
jgi:hypothetical protein